jgi:hypothetical protein
VRRTGRAFFGSRLPVACRRPEPMTYDMAGRAQGSDLTPCFPLIPKRPIHTCPLIPSSGRPQEAVPLDHPRSASSPSALAVTPYASRSRSSAATILSTTQVQVRCHLNLRSALCAGCCSML